MDMLQAAGDDETTEETLLFLVEEGSSTVREEIARRPSIPASVMRVLVRDAEVDVVFALVKTLRQRPAPADVLLKLAVHPEDDVRLLCSFIRDLPDEVVSVLLDDENSHVLASVAEKYVLPPETVDRLIALESSDVWQGLILNWESFSVEAVEALWVRNQKTKNFPSVHDFAVERLAADKRTPVHVLEKLVMYKEAVIPLLVNVNCPLELVERMAMHKGLNANVRWKIASLVAEGNPQYDGYPVEWVETILFK